MKRRKLKRDGGTKNKVRWRKKRHTNGSYGRSCQSWQQVIGKVERLPHFPDYLYSITPSLHPDKCGGKERTEEGKYWTDVIVLTQTCVSNFVRNFH